MKKIATLLLVGAIAGSTMVTNYIPTFAANKIAVARYTWATPQTHR